MSNDNSAQREFALAPPLVQLTALAHGALGQMTPEQCLRGEVAIEARLARAGGRRRGWVVPAVAALGVAAGIALTATVVMKHSAGLSGAPLSYVIENGSQAQDGSLDVPSGPPRVVRFSDGTEVRVDTGTQARVRFVTKHGAALAMSRGALHASVIHSASSEWRFDAGPFVVRVTGTAFGLAWDPEQDRFDLRLEHGSVTVSSPVANDPIPVRAGQWLTIRPRSNEVYIRDLTVATASAAQQGQTQGDETHEPTLGAEPVPSVAEVSPAVSGTTDPQPKPAPDAGHAWARDLAHGRVDQIVDDALRRGLDGCLAEANSSELSALADAARYTRRNDIARKALLAERRRFAGSRRAVDAGLLLGRLAQAEHADAPALTWFDTYLAEAPGGMYASEALGRKMAVVRHSIGAAAARAVAEQYLSKYPEGTYSSAARAILKNP